MPILSFPALSAPPDQNLLAQRLQQIFETTGFKEQKLPKVNHHGNWSFYPDVSSRLTQLELSFESKVDIIWAARGGYGVSDLLGEIDFNGQKSTIFIGFSDFSSLMSARYAKSGGLSWHASMPGGAFWYDDKNVNAFLKQLESRSPAGEISIQEKTSKKIQGKLFGGCFSVLTNLIGTPYFPSSLEGHILILEDIEAVSYTHLTLPTKA